MVVARKGGQVVLAFDHGPPEHSVRPAADVLLRSVAGVYGSGVLAVVLTGMGFDGLKGCTAVRQAGGQVLAQDQASSAVWGMPRAVTEQGLTDLVGSPVQLAAELVRRVRAGR